MANRMFCASAIRRLGRIALLAPGGLALSAGCTGGERTRDSERLRELWEQRAAHVQRFHAVQQGIRRTQAEALEQPGVRRAQESFYTELRQFVAREEPSSLELLDRAKEIGSDLDRLAGPDQISPDQADQYRIEEVERRQVGEELVATEKALRPILARAMRDPAVNSAFSGIRDSVMVAIVRIDPTAAASLDRMREISLVIAELDQQIAQEQLSR